ncbi:MAG: GTP-binding protein [Microgenomates group bacterium]|nr:GTP-binding protein [Microgenomates group bacterium]
MKNIRNFAIIAHVDHGKSTLADRFLEITGVVRIGAHEEQFLDRNPISRERGITIKLAPVKMVYNSYILNLIDTPGHVDFSYEVDRTLACVEGVILLVDATSGIQAQTIANAYKALEKNLVIIPAINKIDLPSANIEGTKKEIADFLGIKPEEIFEVSAKTGYGVRKLLEAVIEKIPGGEDSIKKEISDRMMVKDEERIRALIFDSYYDSHRGVIAFIRVFSGKIKKKDQIKLCNSGYDFEVMETGYFSPELKSNEGIFAGDIGYVVTNLKDIHQVKVGDTMVAKNDLATPLPGYKKVKPMVFASIFPLDTAEYPNLKKALEKLYLNDSSLTFSPIYSQALGAGFRVGFLGLLHADVVRERLEREFNLNLVLTPPQVEYKIVGGQFAEPYVKVMILTPNQYLGAVMKLCEDYRAKFLTMDNKNQISLFYEMPMSELINDFFDNLKSVSSGFASLDWEFLRYEKVEADRLTILLNNDPVAEFSEIVVKERAQSRAVFLTRRLREVIPRQQFEVRVQAKFKGKIIASERIAPFRKDVTKKLYGGDRTRKDKLLEKQKEGKKKMKMIGRVEIPKEAFLKLFKKNG